MADDDPRKLHTDFGAAFAARDLHALLALYEEGAVMINADGSEVVGKAAIGTVLEGFLAAAGADGSITLDTRYVHRAGDLAMLSNEWHLKGRDADGQPLEMSGRTVEVARRQADGRWLFVLDHPTGAQ